MFSIPNLNIDETQSIKVNFYELIQQDKKLFDSSAPNTFVEKETKKTAAINKKTNTDETSIISKFKINKLGIKNEITKIKLSKEREDILRVSAIIQERINGTIIHKPNTAAIPCLIIVCNSREEDQNLSKAIVPTIHRIKGPRRENKPD